MRLFNTFSGLHREPQAQFSGDLPLIVAVHGGTYTSAYFDVPGYSLLDRAAALGMRAIAPDRNGYGDTPPLADSEATILGQAGSLAQGLYEAWQRHGEGCRGIVLIGHSIGAAICARIASNPGPLPLLGLAMSGIGLRTPERNRSVREALADSPFVDMPAAAKDQLMFGPPGSFDPAVMPAASHGADAPAPRAELSDISGGWPRDVLGVLADVRVPVHYRQGEFDCLWIVDDTEVQGFARALVKAPWIDAAIVRGTGHCMDFHRVGAALQVQQLGFALHCAVQAQAD